MDLTSAIGNMRWSASVVAQTGCFIVLWLMSYFGALNPYSLGLLSGLCITSLGFGVSLLARRYGRLAYGVVLVLLCAAYLVLIITNWWYFDYFQSLYNYESLKLGSDILEGTRAIPAVGYRNEALTISLLAGFLAAVSIATYHRPAGTGRSHLAGASICLLIFAAGMLVLNPAVDRYRERNIAWLLPSHLHPVHAFFYSQETMKALQPEEIAVAEDFRQANRVVQRNDLSSQFTASRFRGKKYNVLIVMMESIRADLVGHYSGGVSHTPNLDRLATSYISARNFYANTNFTVSGELAAWCGIFDHNTKPPISKYHDQIESLDCLPRQLRDLGYESLYFHGHNSKFYDRDKFLPLLGFNETYFHADEEEDHSEYMGWGASDLVMVDIVMDRLEGLRDSPFFAHFMTLSSHYPFNNDWGIDVPFQPSGEVYETEVLNKNYKNAAHFADYAIGKFWDRFEKSELFDNTIVVITSDHGIWSFDKNGNEPLALKNERFFRSPLIIYHPDIENPVEITQLSSQIDIPPTISALMGHEDLQSHYIGKNMLMPVIEPWSISFKTSQIMVKEGNRTCFIDADICGGVHQSCSSQFDSSLFWGSDDDMVSCITTDDDLLRGAKINGIEGSPAAINRSQKLINYHNKLTMSY